MKKKIRVLITGGPTWVAVDRIRVLTSIFTGKTAIRLARSLRKKGCSVTLLLHSFSREKIPPGTLVIPFRYFHELKAALIRELKRASYDMIIHSAAVSDYRPCCARSGKIPSGKRKLVIPLVSTPKITRYIHRYAKAALLVQFKLEAEKKGLLMKARQSLRENCFDVVVANDYASVVGMKRRFVITRSNRVIQVESERKLASCLLSMIPKIRG